MTVPTVTGPVEHTVQAEIKDAAGDLVCRVTAVWRLDVAVNSRSPGASR